MQIFCQRRTGVLILLAVFAICFLPSPTRAKAKLPWQAELRSPASNRHSGTIASFVLAQLDKKIRIAVFTFNILNLGAAGYDATISNLFMTLLPEHRILEVMSRKELEESLRRAGLQQSEDIPAVRKAGTRLGLDGIILGNVEKTGNAVDFEVKFVEMARGETLLHRQEKVLGYVALRQKVEEITREIVQIANQYQPQPMVAKEEAPLYPSPPNGLQARGGSQRVVLSWNANKESNLRGYKVFRGTTSMGPFGKVASVTKNTFTDNDLENNQTYYYKIRAFNQEGRESPTSAIIAAETAPSPFSPIILDASSLVGGIKIRWTTNPRKAEDGTEVSGFNIYRANEPEADYQMVGSISAKSGEMSTLRLKKYEYEDSGLEDGSKYYYCLTAFNDRKIESVFSSALEGSTVGRPTGIKATGDMIREIHLQWHSSLFSEIKGYRIYRNTVPEGTFERIGELQSKAKTTFIDQENLGDATTYFYRLSSYDNKGRETGLSEIASATTRGKPPTPEGLTAQSRLVKRVSLSWKARPEKEVEGYYVYWNKSAEGEFKDIFKVKGRNNTTYVDKGDRHRPLDDNSTYYYMITSYNKVDVNSDPCQAVSATTKPRPQSPSGLSAQGGLPYKIALAWNPNPETDIKYFHLFRQRAGEKLKKIKKLSSNKTQYEDDRLAHGTTYLYRLQAEDKDKLLSDFSATAEATTKPLPQSPTGLEAKAIANGLELLWQPNPEPDVVQYKIYIRSFLVDKEIGSTEKIPFSINTLKADEEYTVSITAVDQDGLESNKSESITVRTISEENKK